MAGLALSAGSAALAQTAAADSLIVQVKVYAGSATVEQVSSVSGGSRSVIFASLPAALNVQSLQVSADAIVQIGKTSVLNAPSALTPRCQSNAIDSRIRELEDQKAAMQAESDALDMVTGYLKGFGAGEGAGHPRCA